MHTSHVQWLGDLTSFVRSAANHGTIWCNLDSKPELVSLDPWATNGASLSQLVYHGQCRIPTCSQMMCHWEKALRSFPSYINAQQLLRSLLEPPAFCHRPDTNTLKVHYWVILWFTSVYNLGVTKATNLLLNHEPFSKSILQYSLSLNWKHVHPLPEKVKLSNAIPRFLLMPSHDPDMLVKVLPPAHLLRLLAKSVSAKTCVRDSLAPLTLLILQTRRRMQQKYTQVFL